MNSKEKLAKALSDFNAPQEMIQKAREGYYSDYDSPLTFPCQQLVLDLHKLGLKELASRAVNGEFDATKEESDEWYEKEGKSFQKCLKITVPIRTSEGMKMKSEKLLKDFSDYCKKYPDLRFWQALSSWCGQVIFIASRVENPDLQDTFYFEGKNG